EFEPLPLGVGERRKSCATDCTAQRRRDWRKRRGLLSRFLFFFFLFLGVGEQILISVFVAVVVRDCIAPGEVPTEHAERRGRPLTWHADRPHFRRRRRFGSGTRRHNRPLVT